MTEEKATEKQISFGKKLGITDIESMTKEGARFAIDNMLNKDENVTPEVVNISSKTKTNGEATDFEIGYRKVRIAALASAIEWKKINNVTEDLVSLAKEFEKYIVTGE